MIIISGLALALGAVLIMFGLVLCSDGMDGWHRRRARRIQRRKASRIRPFASYSEGCKDCGMDDLPLDYYDRCSLCAELEELRGGVKSVTRAAHPPIMPKTGTDWTECPHDFHWIEQRQNEPVHARCMSCNAWWFVEAEPAADISSYRMERIGF